MYNQSLINKLRLEISPNMCDKFETYNSIIQTDSNGLYKIHKNNLFVPFSTDFGEMTVGFSESIDDVVHNLDNLTLPYVYNQSNIDANLLVYDDFRTNIASKLTISEIRVFDIQFDTFRNFGLCDVSLCDNLLKLSVPINQFYSLTSLFWDLEVTSSEDLFFSVTTSITDNFSTSVKYNDQNLLTLFDKLYYFTCPEEDYLV